MRGEMPAFDGRSSDDSPAVGNVVVTTDASGNAYIPYGKTFSTSDIVILANGGNGEHVYVLPSQTAVGFTANFQHVSNNSYAISASTSVRCYFIAQPRNV